MTRSIKYPCTHCGAALESEAHYAGKKDTCPMCGKPTSVPLASTIGVEAFLIAIPKAVYVGIATVVLTTTVFTVVWLALRDTWESDHLVQIHALHEQALQLKARGDLEDSSTKLHQVLSLVGNRTLKHNDLRSIVEDSRTRAKEIDRILVLKQLPKQLDDAARLLAADKIAEARTAYQAVLDAVSDGADTPDILRVIELANDGLRQVDARSAAITAEKTRLQAAEEYAKRQEEEKARNAKIRTSIAGGAWSVKGGGQSDLLRGMKVYLLKADCTGASVLRTFQSEANSARISALFARARAKSSADWWRNKAKEEREKPPDEYDISNTMADYSDARAKQDEDKGEAMAIKSEEYAHAVAEAAKTLPNRLDVHDAYVLIRNVTRPSREKTIFLVGSPLDKQFVEVLRECTEQTTQVNIDGKFSFDAVPYGTYYLYALWSTEISSMEWLIPITVKDSLPVAQDLFNGTAEIIWNK